MSDVDPIARCEDPECEELFRPYPHEKETDEGGVFVFLECPHCLSEYPVASISPKGVRIRNQLARLRNAGATTANSRRFRRLLEEYGSECHEIRKGEARA